MMIHSRLCVLAFLITLPAPGILTAQNKPDDDSPASFQTVKEIVDLVPKQTFAQLKMPQKKKAALASANQMFAQKAAKKSAALKVRATDWEPWKHETNPDKLRIIVPKQVINAGGNSMGLTLWVTLADDHDAALAKASKGQELTVAGELILVEVRDTPQEGLYLHLNLAHGKVVRR